MPTSAGRAYAPAMLEAPAGRTVKAQGRPRGPRPGSTCQGPNPSSTEPSSDRLPTVHASTAQLTNRHEALALL